MNRVGAPAPALAAVGWPENGPDLVRLQRELGKTRPDLWHPPETYQAGGVFVCFGRGDHGPGHRGDHGWAATALPADGNRWRLVTAEGDAGAPYLPGLLALREGPLLELAVRSLPEPPEVLLVNATGRDHPRRAGLAFHLGAVLAIPTVGVTHLPLVASGDWPPDTRGAWEPLRIGRTVVGAWVRTKTGTRPVAVHAAWRTDVETAVSVVLEIWGDSRTPEPVRRAREAARTARSASTPASRCRT